MNAETRTIVRSGLDGSAYAAGARQVEQANQRMAASGEAVVKANEKIKQSQAEAGKAGADAVRVTEQATAAVNKRRTAVERLEETIDRTIRQQRKFEQAERIANSAVERGLRTRAEADATIAKARAHYLGSPAAPAAATGTGRLERYQVQNLTAQGVDFGVQVLGGGSPITALIQQGPQAVDAVGGLRNAFTLLRGAVTPTTAAVGALALAIGGSILIAERQGRTMAELSNRLRATRNDYASLARSVEDASRAAAGSSSISTTDARLAGRAIAGSRNFAGSTADLEELIKVANRLGTVMGTDAADGATRLAQALDKPTAAARRMQEEGLRTMDEGLLRSIELLDRQGRVADAARLTIDAYRRAAEQTAKTPLQAALDAAAQSFTRLWNQMRPALEAIGTVLLTGISAVVDRIGRMVDGMAQLARWLGDSRVSQFLFGTGGGAAAPAAVTQRSATDIAMERVRELNPRIRQRQDLQADMVGQRAGLAGANPQQRREINDTLRELQAQYEGLQDPVSQFLRGLRQQYELSRFAAGAARDLAQAEQQANEAARADGRGRASDAERAEARRLTQLRLNEQLGETVDNLDRQTYQERAMAAAILEGSAAQREREATTRAEIEALQYGAVTTDEYARAVEKLTKGYLDLAAAQQRRRDAGAIQDQERTLEYMRAEVSLITLSARARAEELAAIKERQRIQAEGGDPEGDLAQRRIANARTIAGMNQDAQDTAALARDLGDAFSGAFEEFAFGAGKASDLLRQLERDLLRIGTRRLVTEPLTNALTGAIGGGAGMLSSLFGGLFGGGAPAADAPVAHTGGLIGIDALPQRSVAAGLFAGAPRFHGGGWPGLGPDEVPIIAQRGERVLSREEVRRGVGGSVTINISTPNPGAFRESEAQWSGQVTRAVARGRRNV